jgi:hypothetical protein
MKPATHLVHRQEAPASSDESVEYLLTVALLVA